MLNLGFRLKLFIASISIVVITILCMAGVNFVQSRSASLAGGVAALENTSSTFGETIAMQDRLARSNIASDLNIFKSIMNVSGLPMLEMLYDVEMTITNQETGETEDIIFPAFKLGSKYLHESTRLVDSMMNTTGIQSSALQFNNNRLIRVSTTILDEDGAPVQGLYIPENSQAYAAVMEGTQFQGMMTIAGDWYIVTYESIRDFDEKVIGALEVARPVITDDFAAFIQSVNVGGKGYSYVMRADGEFAVAPLDPEAAAAVAPMIVDDATVKTQGGVVTAQLDGDSVQSSVVRFEPWDAYLITNVDTADLLEGVNERIVKNTLSSALPPLLIAIAIIWFMSRQLLAPMNKLAATADDVCKGNFECNFDYRADDAIGRTMESVNHMVGEMKRQLGFSRGVLEGVTIPCAVVDIDNKVTHINQSAVTILGKRKEPVKYFGLTLNEVVYHDENRETLTQVAIKKRKQVEWEIELTRDVDNVTVTLHVVSTPIYDLDHVLIGAIIIWVDLTEERTQKKAVEAKNLVIEEAAREANAIAQSVSESSQQLAAKIVTAKDGADEQRDRAQEASTAMEEMNSTVLEVARNAQLTAQMSEETSAMARDGEGVVGKSVEMMRQVHEQSQGLRNQMNELDEHAKGIGAIMGVITDIADQTNLLALNAAIEAARAGEAGRGFAVVADEVRKLAEKTMAATHEVGGYIKSIQESATANIKSNETANAFLEECSAMVEQSGESLTKIVAKADEAAMQVSNIATAAEEQSSTSEEINEATETVTRIAVETAASMQESAQAIEDLKTMAENLRRAIGKMTS